VFCSFDMLFNIVIVFINIGFLSIQGLFRTFVLKMWCDWLLGHIINTSLFRGKDNCRTEGFPDGSIRENKMSFLRRDGRLGSRWGNKSETFLQAVGRVELRKL
jgi:hypothetical protein